MIAIIKLKKMHYAASEKNYTSPNFLRWYICLNREMYPCCFKQENWGRSTPDLPHSSGSVARVGFFEPNWFYSDGPWFGDGFGFFLVFFHKIRQ